ncbi:MAG: GGDEF domain-containing protein [Candidatus Magnetoovum sp. WYHC-5]|nr:GGDEF domain-containing protein [Candidatus Magnetoovum sp. WYHC-5]
MFYNKLLSEAKGNLKKALEFISEHHLPPTPPCYMVIYEYVAGKNKHIAEEIDNFISENNRVDIVFINALYDNFYTCSNVESMNEFYVEIEKILMAVLTQTELTGNGITDYNQTLQAHLLNLKRKHNSETIGRIVMELIQSTEVARQSMVELQSCLDSVKEEAKTLREQIEKIKKEAATDLLTGLLNRRSFDAELAEFIEESCNSGVELSVLMIDIDYFKQINDTYGHLIGDEVLQFLGKNIKKCIRGTDIAGRYGGEEFSIILPNTPLCGARQVAETIRKTVKKIRLVKKRTNEYLPSITISVGVTMYRKNETKEDFLDRADSALYKSKQHGRNRTTVE